MHRSRGFSLVAVMVAASIMSGLVLVVMQLQKQSTTAVRTMEAGSEIVALVAELRAALSDPDQCRETLLNLTPTNLAEGTIKEIKIITNDGATPPNFHDRYLSNIDPTAGVAYGQGKIKILGYSLSDSNSDVSVASDSTTALAVRFYRGKTAVTQEITKNIKIWVDLEGGATIKNCRSLSATENNIWSREQVSQNNIFYGGGNVAVIDTFTVGSSIASATDTVFIEAGSIKTTGLLDVGSAKISALLEAGTAKITGLLEAGSAVIVGEMKSGTIETGDVTAGAVSGVSFSASSDRRLKSNLQIIDEPLDKIKHVTGLTYNKKGCKDREAGVIAQEIEKVLPEVVTTDSHGYKSVNYGAMNALLIEALKATLNKVELLEKDLCEKDPSYSFCNI